MADRRKPNRVLRGAGIAIALLCALLVASCKQADSAVPAAEPVSLDLSNTGLNDITPLLTRTDLTSLDLRGDPISIEQYQTLAAALPSCEIRWSVPVGSQRVENDAVSAVLACGVSDLEAALPYLPKLADVKFSTVNPEDYAPLAALAASHPGLNMRWDVQLCGEVYPQDTVSLDLSTAQADAGALATALQGLPKCTQVRLGEDAALTAEEQLSLARQFPKISFIWTVNLLQDFSVSSDATEIDLRGHRVRDAAVFSDSLALLPKLTYADLCNCGLSDEQMLALRARYPAVKFVWMIRVADWEIRTDIKGFSTGQLFQFPDGAGGLVGSRRSYKSFQSGDFENLTLCTDLVALDVGHCVFIGDIGFIARLPKLKYLVVSLCDITDLSPLAGQTELEFLEIKYNYINDLSPLAACTKIRFLNCANNEISDFSVVKNMPALERLWISMNRFTMDQVETLRAELPNVDIKASLKNPEYAESLWRKGNEGYLAMQALFGMRAQNQGTKLP